MKAFFLLLLLSQASFAEVLSLKDFLSKAKENDPNIQSIVADRMKTKYLVDLNLPTRQLLLSVKSEYGFSSEGQTSVLSAIISKPILETGTVLSVGRTMTERPDRDEEVTEMRIEQALYRNAFGSQVRAKIDALETEQEIIELQVVEAYEDYILEIMHNYLDLTLAYLNFQTSRRLHQESSVLLDNVRARRKRNIASTTDVSRARLQAAQRKENELQSLTELETQGEKIKRIIGEESEGKLLPETLLDMSPGIEDIDRSIKDYLNLSRSRLIYDKQEAVAMANLDIEKENLRPAANLLLGFNIDDSQRFGSSVKREEAVVGLRIDIPFGSSVVDAQIKEASLQLRKSKLAKKSFTAAMKESLASIKNQILRQKEKVLLSKTKRELAASIVKDEEKRYSVGRITLEKLIEDRNVQAQAEFSYLYELTVLNKLIVNWMALTDTLISKTEII